MITLTSLQHDTLAAADRGDLTFANGWFRVGELILSEPDADQVRGLIFAGLIEHHDGRYMPTAAGRLEVR